MEHETSIFKNIFFSTELSNDNYQLFIRSKDRHVSLYFFFYILSRSLFLFFFQGSVYLINHFYQAQVMDSQSKVSLLSAVL